MKKIETKIPGVVIIEPDIHGDHRGYFMETYSTSNFHELGIDNVFVQDNMSFTAKKGTLRGLHLAVLKELLLMSLLIFVKVLQLINNGLQ